jgi:selenide,water dikinase
MIDATTRLNTPGPDLSGLPGVHAMTDVTGFGLAGHALEMVRGQAPAPAPHGPAPGSGDAAGEGGLGVRLAWGRVPLLEGVRALAAEGAVTGASGRNWASYGGEVQLGPGVGEVEQALLTDPQTSGGLLVACAPEAVAGVLEVFRAHGFAACADVGEIVTRAPGGREALLLVE